MSRTIWTIGHSNRTLDAFVELLRAYAIDTVADVRRYPGSRRLPHFGTPALPDALAQQAVGYVAMPELGGRRTARPDSRNVAWRNASFRGYADYMETDAFAEALMTLETLARAERIAIMCAEALWWRCHRGLIADALTVNGFEVLHIFAPGKVEAHPMTAAARVVDGLLTYTDTQARLDLP